ncbi:hypothetical protein DCC39_07495 [Pueribacillus theae]|uniref:Uncharacterized protein n=1 Tax=Pueribacillus theae TaxID=2171751 RepID=A0A2U1K490_9BACI|nr:hypothetical protein [Pueribacillus theae]PWA12085.1 hypothetical protein DCC39_07495 [Pueribacillus theae]
MFNLTAAEEAREKEKIRRLHYFLSKVNAAGKLPLFTSRRKNRWRRLMQYKQAMNQKYFR